MRGALVVAMVVVVALSGALAWRTYRRRPAPPPVVEVCAARDVKPPVIHPEFSAVPLLANHPGVTLRIDGSEQVPQTLLAGVHQLEASAPEARGSSFPIVVRPLAAVLLEARVVDGVVTVLVLGARCKSCEVARTELDVRFQPRALGSLGDAAAALSSGDWIKAAGAMRAISEEERNADFIWSHAVLLAFAGQPSKAIEQLERLPASDASHEALKQFNARTAEVPKHLLATATARWNATTERFERLTTEFSGDAPELVTQLTQRFAALSEKFSSALTAKEAVDAETALEDATDALNQFIDALRAARSDCAWQQRITHSF